MFLKGSNGRGGLISTLAVVLVLLGLCGSALAEDPVNIPDANLKVAIEDELGVIDPTPTDMLGLTSLDASSGGIVDLTGIEYATNLTGLYLGHNKISDISSVSVLIKLTDLDLGSNLISDCNVVSELTNLDSLYLENNQISDCNAVSGLTKLWTLFLNDNQISDCNCVSELTDLTWLILGDNQIADINAVSGLTKLTHLELYGNQISDISAISGLTSLRYLYLYDNQISDISVVSGLTDLVRLTLGTNRISDISALSEHTNLVWLTLYENPLTTTAYCFYLPLIEANNSSLSLLLYDPNPNPLTKDCTTDLISLGVFVSHWLEADCNEVNNWCGWADMEHLGDVDFYNFSVLASYWVGGVNSYIEDFETGDFSRYNWVHSGDASWFVATDEVYQGSYSCRSGSISHNQQSVLEITPDIEIGSISFYRKVSSENYFDYLRFYIDGQQEDTWLGEEDWELQTYTITPGQHTIKWAYIKSAFGSGGSDCAWIDEITMSK